MATAENKNQLTLYRFVSLRSPELSKKENQEKRFVFHPDEKTGVFFDAIKNKPTSQTNWDAMRIASGSFLAFVTEAEIENLDKNIYQASDWLAANKNNLEPKILLEKLKGVKPIDLKIELNLWDNLFYQVVTQKSFYIKESLIQILVLNNLLKQILNLVDEEALKLLPTLTNAKVVLPKNLFESLDEENIVAKTDLKAKELVLSSNVQKAQEIQTSKINISNLETIIEELRILEAKYFKGYQSKYSTEFALHEKKIAPIVADFQKKYDAEIRKKCDIPKPIDYDPTDFCNIPDIALPVVPEFNFVYPPQIDLKVLQKQLSKENYEFLSPIVDKNEPETFQEIIELVNIEIQKQSKIISENTITSEARIMIADAMIQNSTTNNILTFQICSTAILNGKVSIYMSIELPTSSFQVESFNYNLQYSNNEGVSNFAFNQTSNGNTLTLSNLFNNNLILVATTQKFSGEITFTNGLSYSFEITPFLLRSCYIGKLTPVLVDDSDTNSNNSNDSFIPKSFGYKQLGIADYKKVVAEVCCYEAGEVAHIENVMASELRSKTTTKTFRSEVTDFESTEVESESMSDTTSTQRFEMQTEVANLLAEQQQISAYANVSSSFGTTTLDAGGSYASNTSKEESNRQAVNQAKELTQRAVEKLVTKTRKEKTVKITNEFVEENDHTFDNRNNKEHISGVFRFINAVYKNQIYNYGKRLMYEFTVPQPSKLHQLAMKVANNTENATLLEVPIDPVTLGITDFTKISNSNYQNLAAKYNAQEVNTKPDEFVYVGKAFGNAEKGRDMPVNINAVIPIPDNYKSVGAKILSTGNAQGYSSGWWGVVATVHIGSRQTTMNNSIFNVIDNFYKEVPINIGTFGFHLLNITVTIQCQLSEVGYSNWQKDTYDKIIAGYQEQLRQYNEKLVTAKTNGVQILDSNPLFYRQIEQQVLRKNCISYLLDNSSSSARRFGQKMYTGSSMTDHQIDQTLVMDNYGSFVKFMEQAFEWNLMSYNFYPYYWGNKDEWASLYQYETNDPIFRNFMQAGMARVVVTVKPGFEEAIMHYLATNQIWNGGQTPVIGDPLFLSIVDELKEQEYVVEETWKTVVPTHLIGLQKSGVSVDEEGLPCSCPVVDELNKTLIPNDNTLLGK